MSATLYFRKVFSLSIQIEKLEDFTSMAADLGLTGTLIDYLTKLEGQVARLEERAAAGEAKLKNSEVHTVQALEDHDKKIGGLVLTNADRRAEIERLSEKVKEHQDQLKELPEVFQKFTDVTEGIRQTLEQLIPMEQNAINREVPDGLGSEPK